MIVKGVMHMSQQRTPLTIDTLIAENKNIVYKVVEILGCGGSAICYKVLASDHNFYALKEIYPSELAEFLCREDNGKLILNPLFHTQKLEEIWQWYKTNLQNEAKKQAEISHNPDIQANDPYFIKCYGTFIATNGNLYAKFDMQTGRTLSQALEQDSLPPNKLIAILLTAIKKLKRLHNRGMLHLDISPNNLYLINHGLGEEAYLMDYGSAKKSSDPDSYYRFSATPGFSSQEVYARAQANHSSIYKTGAFSDTYSITAILFYGLIGDLFSVDYKLNSTRWMTKLRQNLQKFGFEDSTDRLVNILEKGLSDKNKRYQTAKELFDDLNDAYQSMTEQSRETTFLLENIESRLDRFENLLSKKIESEGEKIKKTITLKADEIEQKIDSNGRQTRNIVRIVLICASILFIIACIFIFEYLMQKKREELEKIDREAPEILLTNCRQLQGDYIITGNSFEALLKISDNKQLDWYHISDNDIRLDGFEGYVHTQALNDGLYRLMISEIHNKSDDAKIVISEGCAKDASGNKTGEITLPVSFTTMDKSDDFTPPAFIVGIPTSNLNSSKQHLIPVGGDLLLVLSIADETELNKVNVTEQYIKAVDFQYDKFVSSCKNNTYYITFTNVRGNDGEHHVYFAPGLAIDTNYNYNSGIESIFYLYSDEKNIDIACPEIEIINSMISDTTLEYRLEIKDNMSIRSFNLRKKDITMVGFSAEIEIKDVPTSSNQHIVRIIRFTNVRSTSDSNDKYFIVNSGIAIDSFNNQTSAGISPSFTIP